MTIWIWGLYRSSIKANRHLNPGDQSNRVEKMKVTSCLSYDSIHWVGLHTCYMGNSSSIPIVLEGMLRNFNKGFPGDYGLKLAPWKLKSMCDIDWLSFGVGWLSEGTLNVPTIRNVHRITTGDPSHPNQFPYIDQWLEIAWHKPPLIWLCECKKGQSKALVAARGKETGRRTEAGKSK